MKIQNRNKLYATRSLPAGRQGMLQGQWVRGQILLILVMIMAIAITIVLTITFTTRTDTQITKLEEESQKALAAAQAGIESSLKSNAAISNLETKGNLGSNITSGSTTVTADPTGTFTSPNIVSGEAYTVYLGTYTPGSPASYGSSSATDVTICFGDTTSQPSLDISLVKDPDVVPPVKRYLADPGTKFAGDNKLTVSSGPTACPGNSAFAYSVTVLGVDVAANSRLLVVRTMYAGTKLFISASGLPAQGKTVTSQATTKTGVTKKVQLFQSYPQIPAEFYFTSF